MQMNKNCYKVVTSTVTGLQIEAQIHYHLDSVLDCTKDYTVTTVQAELQLDTKQCIWHFQQGKFTACLYWLWCLVFNYTTQKDNGECQNGGQVINKIHSLNTISLFWRSHLDESTWDNAACHCDKSHLGFLALCWNKDRIKSMDWNGKSQSNTFVSLTRHSLQAPCSNLLWVIYDVEINLT